MKNRITMQARETTTISEDPTLEGVGFHVEYFRIEALQHGVKVKLLQGTPDEPLVAIVRISRKARNAARLAALGLTSAVKRGER